MSFFANVTGIEQPELANNPYDNWTRRAMFENKAICMYLGIEYNENDFTTSGVALARSWAQSLPGKEWYENNIHLHIMGQRKGQTGNPKGRPKGVPNKVTTDLKTWIASILDDGRDKFKKDMDDLDSSERVKVYINLINYVLPKQQAVSVEAQAEAEYKALASLIDTAPDEFVNKIAEKVLSLQKTREKLLK